MKCPRCGSTLTLSKSELIRVDPEAEKALRTISVKCPICGPGKASVAYDFAFSNPPEFPEGSAPSASA